MNTDQRRYKPVRLHLILLPLGPLLAILAAVVMRHDVHEAPAPGISVVVEQQPEQQIPATRHAPPVFKVEVKDEPPEFDRSIASPRPVKVTIIDEKEERPPVKALPVKVLIKDEDACDIRAVAGILPQVDPKARVSWQYGPGMRFGIGAVETKKLLTYAANGATNQTLLRVNGQIGEYGGPLGTFLERDARLPPDPARKTHGGSKSVWVSGKIHYTQILELVPSKQPVMVRHEPKLLLDTVQVRYLIENKDTKTLRAGLRTQIDTLIGGNDGVPFTVPGLGGLVTHFADFPRVGPIPDFIQALERPNLRDPGTVAHFSLKLGNGIEWPGRVSLTHWPGTGYANWDVPLAPIARDSAVVLYWNDKPLKPGEIRQMGFAYGLGNVVSNDPGGKLGMTLGGSFEPGEAFTVTAYVQGPQKGQTVSLELPQGLERLEGDEVQNVPSLAPGVANSIVTWKVKVLDTGSFPVRVVSSNGLSQAKTITIARPDGMADLHLKMNLLGSFEPGQEFTVEAMLSGPETQSRPVLTLPGGLSQSEGPLLKADASTAGKGFGNLATWKVKVLQPGTYPVRVEWSGATTTKTVSIVRPETPRGGYVRMAFCPPFVPGQAFTVIASVSGPTLGQKLTLQLPDGLRFAVGSEEMPVVPTRDGAAVVEWKVLVYQPGTYPLRLMSSTGLVLKKTITIEQSESKGGDFKLEYLGDIAPGKEFTVLAKVTDPVPGQKLTLMPLPAGLALVDGPAAKAVPAPATEKDGGGSEVAWRIRVLDAGRLSVRVASTTGTVQSFTITITVEPLSGGGRLAAR
jgi:predicted secreted protein